MNQSGRISGMLMYKPWGAGVIHRFHPLNELHHLVFRKTRIHQLQMHQDVSMSLRL